MNLNGYTCIHQNRNVIWNGIQHSFVENLPENRAERYFSVDNRWYSEMNHFIVFARSRIPGYEWSDL